MTVEKYLNGNGQYLMKKEPDGDDDLTNLVQLPFLYLMYEEMVELKHNMD